MVYGGDVDMVWVCGGVVCDGVMVLLRMSWQCRFLVWLQDGAAS